MMTSFKLSKGVALSCLATVFALPACGDDKSAKSDNTAGSSSQSGSSNGNGNGGSSATGGKPGENTAGKANTSGGSSSGGTSNAAGGTPPITNSTSTAAEIARKLGRKPNFLIGMGNDLPSDYVWENSGIYTLGTPLDIHYIYLVAGWQDWNPDGTFPVAIGEVDKEKGTVPMATVYAVAGNGENNFETLVDDEYMTQYWANAKVLMQRYAELDVPAIVHVEPDFWAYGQQRSGGDPSTVKAKLHADCKDLPQDLSGFGRCWIKLARTYAPKVVIGLHASEWAGDDGNEVGGFLKKLGAGEGDIIVIDILDRDAGCFEDGTLEQCQRDGSFYLDESNTKSPNYHERLEFAKQVSATTGKPILWWQLPFGVPSDKAGGTPGHFRDNKVHYVFSHIQEFVDAGGVGVAFGTGAEDQTFITTDGGQFKKAVTAYNAAPVPLP